MANFSFLKGVILTFSVGVGGGGVENCTIRLNSVPLSLSWGLTELGNTFFSNRADITANGRAN